jgi:hypothetical protein
MLECARPGRSNVRTSQRVEFRPRQANPLPNGWSHSEAGQTVEGYRSQAPKRNDHTAKGRILSLEPKTT